MAGAQIQTTEQTGTVITAWAIADSTVTWLLRRFNGSGSVVGEDAPDNTSFDGIDQYRATWGPATAAASYTVRATPAKGDPDEQPVPYP